MNEKDTNTASYEKYQHYAKGVLDGTIKAGKYVKASAARYLSWFDRDDIEFRTDKADKVINFISNLSKGKNKSLQIALQEWQKFILYAIFGWYYKDTDLRVTHLAYIEVARKNGKSTLISLIALYMTIADDEYKAECDIVANSHKQAMLLYGMSNDYCESIDPKSKYFIRYRDSIHFKKTKSVLQVLASDTKNLDGYNAHLFVQDEVHEAPNDLLFNVMRTSQAARKNPLGVLITTAGLNMNSFCYSFRQNAIEVTSGVKEDDALFSIVYTLDDDDDWEDEENWIKANPNIDVSVRRSMLKEQVTQAKNSPGLESNIKTKHFNIWSQHYDIWLAPQLLIDSSENLDWDFFKGKQCYVGVDLAAVSDLTCFTLMTYENGKYYFKTNYYIPVTQLENGVNQHKYREWKKEGYLKTTPSNITDYDYIINDFVRLRNEGILIDTIYYDSWNSTSWATTMTEEGFNLQPYSQSLGSFNKPSKEFQRLINGGKVVIDNNPITRYCFSNATLKSDWNDNIKPIKAHTQDDKIDGVISIIESLGGYLQAPRYTALI